MLLIYLLSLIKSECYSCICKAWLKQKECQKLACCIFLELIAERTKTSVQMSMEVLSTSSVRGSAVMSATKALTCEGLYSACFWRHSMAAGEKSHAKTNALGLICRIGNTVFPTPHPTCSNMQMGYQICNVCHTIHTVSMTRHKIFLASARLYFENTSTKTKFLVDTLLHFITACGSAD